MDFLKEIDWLNHDGVNRSMINDFMRNQFYDRILSRYVAGYDCVDIGFGTGLLSMLALKHGARHIRAYESDFNRYQLGQNIIDELKLNDRIELINARFDRSYDQRAVTFTETVSGNTWGEGLWNTLPDDPEQIFLPGTYFLEMWAVPIPERFARGLRFPTIGHSEQCFNPGVDIDRKFIDLINKYQNLDLPDIPPLSQGIVRFNRDQHTDWGWIPYMRAIRAGKVVAQYRVSSHTPEMTHFKLEIDTTAWRDQYVLLVPRAGMKQDDDVLYLDTGHWGPTEDPVLLVRPDRNVIVLHNLSNGRIAYSLKD